MIPLPPKGLTAYLHLWIISVRLCSTSIIIFSLLGSGYAAGRSADESAKGGENIGNSLKGIDIPIEDTNVFAYPSNSVHQPPLNDPGAGTPNNTTEGAAEVGHKENTTSVHHGESNSGSSGSSKSSEEPTKATVAASLAVTTASSTTGATIVEVDLVTPNTTSAEANATNKKHGEEVGATVDPDGHTGNRTSKKTTTTTSHDTTGRTTASVSATTRVVHVQLVTSYTVSTVSATEGGDDVTDDTSSQNKTGDVKNVTPTRPGAAAPSTTPSSTTTEDQGVIVEVELVTKTTASTDKATTGGDSENGDGEKVAETTPQKGNDDQTSTTESTDNITQVVEAFRRLNATKHHLGDRKSVV